MKRLLRMGAVGLAMMALGCAEPIASNGGDLGSADAARDLDVRDLDSADAGDGGDLGSNGDLGPGGDLGVALVCAGEKYDVNASAADACELTDAPLANHSQATSVLLGTFNCDDGASSQNVSGTVLADARTHMPAVGGMDPASGSAPDWFQIVASGGLCANDLNLHLKVTGSSKPTCYKLTAQTNQGTYSCQSNAAGACDISNGQGSYGDDTNIFLNVTKTCPGNDKASYTITGHL